MAQANDFQVLVTFPDEADEAATMGLTAFTLFFAERLRRERPDAMVAIVDDLHLKLQDGGEFKQDLRLDNAHKRYLRRPEELEEIVALYLRSLLAPPQRWNLQACDENLRPVLRSKDFLKEMNGVLTRGQDGRAASPPVWDRINDQISVLYVFDRSDSLRYVQARDLEMLFTERRELFSRAVSNLRDSLGEVRIEEFKGCYRPVVRGGDAASLLFLSEYWTKARFPVKGNIVVFPLSRELVLVTGSEEPKALARAIRLAVRAEGAYDYFITDKPFIWKDGRWLPFRTRSRRGFLGL